MEELPKIEGVTVTHTFRGDDCIILGVKNNINLVQFVDGSTEKIHRTRLIPIRERKK